MLLDGGRDASGVGPALAQLEAAVGGFALEAKANAGAVRVPRASKSIYQPRCFVRPDMLIWSSGVLLSVSLSVSMYRRPRA